MANTKGETANGPRRGCLIPGIVSPGFCSFCVCGGPALYVADRLRLPQPANHDLAVVLAPMSQLRRLPRIVLFRSLNFKCRLARYSKIAAHVDRFQPLRVECSEISGPRKPLTASSEPSFFTRSASFPQLTFVGSLSVSRRVCCSCVSRRDRPHFGIHSCSHSSSAPSPI